MKLRREDAGFERKMLFICAAKGRKDRCVMLSAAAAALREYLRAHETAGWIFSGRPADKHLSVRSAQKVFDQALRKRG